MNAALDEINVHHIDYFSLDVEGVELFVLNSMKNEMSSGKMSVDVWSIEFRVYDGTRIIEKNSFENLEKLRTLVINLGFHATYSTTLHKLCFAQGIRNAPTQTPSLLS
jgi:hypothetical protein